MAIDPMVIIATVSSVAAGGAGVLLVADRRERSNNQRVAGIVTTYRPNRAMAPALRRAVSTGSSYSPTFHRILSFLAIRADRPDLYPMPWWALLFLATAFTAAVESLAYLLIGPSAMVALPVGWIFFSRVAFAHFENRRNKILYRQLPDALSMIVRSVRVGVTVQDSLRVVSEEAQWPTSTEFQRLVDEIRVGSTLTDALARLADRSKLIEYRFFAVALALQSQSGGSLSETLENLAEIVRKRVALRARALALAGEARLTMYVLAGLPFFTTAVLMVIEPDYLMVLVTTSMGKKLLFAGITLLAMGMVSMQVIIKKSVS
jgi:tight adherence protein B